MAGPRPDGVSFVITIYDKVPFLPLVVDALRRQTGGFEREFVFIDDGSNDGSADLLERLTAGWPERVVVRRQPNRGASAATNEGVAQARLRWIKLVDGDDLLVDDSAATLLAAAAETGEDFAYGDLGTYDFAKASSALLLPVGSGNGAVVRSGAARESPTSPQHFPASGVEMLSQGDGLARFIRNCPANSSSILVAAERYRAAGGCDERLVSPDQVLFLRLFATGGGVHVPAPVALVPTAAPGRLSGQSRRSRYESVLALYNLVTQTPGLDPAQALLAYRRALSRAARFHRAHGGFPLSAHFWRFLVSLVRRTADPQAMYAALAAFTEDGSTERPAGWIPAAVTRARSSGTS